MPAPLMNRIILNDEKSPTYKKLFLKKKPRRKQVLPMTSLIKPPSSVKVPSVEAGKTRGAKRSPSKGIFGLLPDWKIDTQQLKDELRD